MIFERSIIAPKNGPIIIVGNIVSAAISPTKVADNEFSQASHVITTRNIHNPFTAAADPMK
jgi:hypothetical protein